MPVFGNEPAAGLAQDCAPPPIAILYVDDEPCLLDVTKIFLESTGTFTVTTAESGMSALGHLQNGVYDAIVADYQMPGMDGIELLRHVRAGHGEIPFVLFTGKGREEVATEAIRNGADAYLQKGGAAKAQFTELAQRITVLVERQQARAMLRETEQKYRALFESAADAILIAQVERDEIRFIEVNRSSVLMFGMDAGELVAAGPIRISPEFQPDGHPSAEGIRAAYLRAVSGETVVMDWVHTRKGGGEFPCEVTIKKIGAGGRILVMATVRDVTGRKQAYEALFLTNRKLSLLNTVTRHDIRNNLVVLDAYLHLLDVTPAGRNPSPYVGKLKEASREIGRQIEFLREYQEIGSSEPGWQDLCGILDEVKSRFDPAQIRIENGIDPGVLVFADPMLGKVFFNLVQNAVLHGNYVRTVSIFLRHECDRFTIIVQDDGVGIDFGYKERVFERGYGKNSGLGLFLIREILGITGLAIRETGMPGDGARFEILVPAPAFRILILSR